MTNRTPVVLSLIVFGSCALNLTGAAPAESPEARLQGLGIELPQPPQPVATYSTAVRVGNLLFVSGHGPSSRGKVGRDLTLEEGRAAARETALLVLSTVRGNLGTLDRVSRVVKVLGMVNATDDFTEHPRVINGFSDLMVEIFGEGGRAARSAVGVASLPFGMPVEIEAVFEVRE